MSTETKQRVNKFANQRGVHGMKPALASSIIEIMGGEERFDHMHDNISMVGIDRSFISKDTENLGYTWADDCLTVFIEHKDECLRMAADFVKDTEGYEDLLEKVTEDVNSEIADNPSYLFAYSPDECTIDNGDNPKTYKEFEGKCTLEQITNVIEVGDDAFVRKHIAVVVVEYICLSLCSDYGEYLLSA